MINRKKYTLRAGSIANLEVRNEQLPDPAPGEIQVEVRAIGLNFADVFAIWGLYSATPEGEFTPGLEYAGVVRAIGEGVERHRVGDRVMGVTRFGAYATYLNIEAEYCIPLPAEWSFSEGSAYLVQVLTAYYGLVELGAIQRKDTVLIHSAAGGVGTLANRIAKQFGAYTIGTVGSEQKVAYCRNEGYDDVIVRGRDFAEQLDRALGDRPLHGVMECIGGKVLQAGYDRLAPRGRMIIYGSASYAQSSRDKPNYLQLFWQYLRRPRIDPQAMIQSNKGILGFNLIYLYEEVELMYRLLGEIEKLDIGKPVVGTTFSFDELPEAIRTFRSGKTMGKVVVNV